MSQGDATIVSRYAGTVSTHLKTLFGRGSLAGFGEADLLRRFAVGGDAEAFSALVARHGPMVLGVCRRVLRQEHDVEDAFQATFLVLARRAGAIRNGDLVGPWLHGVAHRVAVRARANTAKRLIRDSGDASEVAARDPKDRELNAVVDEELARLPERMRAPLVLCYLEGLTHDEAAARLGCPVGTVRSRLARGREVLGRRLTRRGFAPEGSALAAPWLAPTVPPPLIASTIRASLGFSSSQAALAASASAAALAQGVIQAMIIAKWKLIAITALSGLVTLGGVQTFAQLGGSGSGTTASKPSTVLQSIDKLQGQLSESKEQIAKLEAQLKALRDEVEALRATPKEASRVKAVAELPVVSKEEFIRKTSEKPAEVERPPTEKASAPKPQGHYPLGDGSLLIVSAAGIKAAVYHGQTGKTERVNLVGKTSTPQQATPVFGNGVVAFSLTGANVTRLAVYIPEPIGGMGGRGAIMMGMQPGKEAAVKSRWHTVDLREPVISASPVVFPGGAEYKFGRFLYRFPGPDGEWEVVEFPEGIDAVGPNPSRGGLIQYEKDGHIFTYDSANHSWKDLDTLKILEGEDGNSVNPPKAKD